MPIETKAPAPPVVLRVAQGGAAPAPAAQDLTESAAHELPQPGPSCLPAEAQYQAGNMQQMLLSRTESQDARDAACQPGAKRAAETPGAASPPKRFAAEATATSGLHGVLTKYLADEKCQDRFEAFQLDFSHCFMPAEAAGTIQSMGEPDSKHPDRPQSIFTNCFTSEQWTVEVNNFSRHEGLTLTDVLLGQFYRVTQELGLPNELPKRIVVETVLCPKTHSYCEKAVRRGAPIDLGSMRSPLGRSLVTLLNYLGVAASSVQWNSSEPSLTVNLRP